MNYDNAGSLPEKIGTIPIVQFDCPEALEQGHNNKMVYNDESGAPKIMKGTENIKQYATEISNTNIYDELNDLMFANTGEYNLNVLLLTHLAEVGEVMDTG